jgi:hypothetical protein
MEVVPQRIFPHSGLLMRILLMAHAARRAPPNKRLVFYFPNAYTISAKSFSVFPSGCRPMRLPEIFLNEIHIYQLQTAASLRFFRLFGVPF